MNSIEFSGWDSIVELNKMQIFRFSTENMFFDAWFVLSAFIGGALLSFASHGADYMMVQRVLTCKSLKSARMAMIGSGVFVFYLNFYTNCFLTIKYDSFYKRIGKYI